MPFIHNPPPMPPPPIGWDDSGLTGGKQAECVWGEFGTTDVYRSPMSMRQPQDRNCLNPLTVLSSGGMSACSAVFLWFIKQNKVYGAVIHFDGGGDPGGMFNAILRDHGMCNAFGRLGCTVYLVTDDSFDMSGNAAYNSIVTAGFNNIVQYGMPRGSAAMDALGNVFDHYA